MAANVVVACLCAEWCHVCRDWRKPFALAQTRFPSARFAWIDIEDEADLVDALDVEDFPTLLVVVDGKPAFYGAIAPQPATLERLLQSCIDDAAPQGLQDADRAGVADVALRLQARLASAPGSLAVQS